MQRDPPRLVQGHVVPNRKGTRQKVVQQDWRLLLLGGEKARRSPWDEWPGSDKERAPRLSRVGEQRPDKQGRGSRKGYQQKGRLGARAMIGQLANRGGFLSTDRHDR